MDAPAPCLTEPVLLELSAGRLRGEEAVAARQHLDVCKMCRRRLGELSTEFASSPDDDRSAPTVVVEPETLSLDPEESPAGGDDAAGAGFDFQVDLRFLAPTTYEGSLGLIGDYEVLGVLGGGGMGVVFKALDRSLQRLVAVKVMAPRLATSETARRRFLREARAAAAIKHANVVTIHAVSVHNDTPYLVMEYIGGESLRQRIRKGPPLQAEQVLRVGYQVASGLAAAHEQGVIHRDIKPANIMLEGGIERVKITDFGLALAVAGASGITSADQTVGTPAYMSPEQVTSSRTVDPRSDLFSLGCVLYAMLTGHSPFQGGHFLEVVRNVCEYDPPPAHEANRDTPRPLSDVVRRLLEKSPKDRYQSAAEVAAVLAQLLAERNVSAATSGTSRSSGVGGRIIRPVGSPRLAAWVGSAGLATALVFLSVRGLLPAGPRKGLRPLPFASAGAGPAALPPPAPVQGGVITVARTAPADVSTFAEALHRAGPGTTIRVLDDAVYAGPVRVADRDRLRGLTIEAPKHATIEAPADSVVVLAVEDTPGVTVRGLNVRANAEQHAVTIGGLAEGLRLDDLRLTQPPTAQKAVVFFLPAAHGTAKDPIVLRGITLDGGSLSVGVFGRSENPAAHIRLEDSRVTGTGVLLLFGTAVRDVTVTRTIFVGGDRGLNINLPLPGQSGEVRVSRNTYFHVKDWLGLVETSFDQGDISVCDNLILEADGVAAAGQDLATVAGKWFCGNVWVPGPGTDESQARQVAEVRAAFPVLSTDPAHADFLVPVPAPGASPEAGGDGAGPAIGARGGPRARPRPRRVARGRGRRRGARDRGAAGRDGRPEG